MFVKQNQYVNLRENWKNGYTWLSLHCKELSG